MIRTKKSQATRDQSEWRDDKSGARPDPCFFGEPNKGLRLLGPFFFAQPQNIFSGLLFFPGAAAACARPGAFCCWRGERGPPRASIKKSHLSRETNKQIATGRLFLPRVGKKEQKNLRKKKKREWRFLVKKARSCCFATQAPSASGAKKRMADSKHATARTHSGRGCAWRHRAQRTHATNTNAADDDANSRQAHRRNRDGIGRLSVFISEARPRVFFRAPRPTAHPPIRSLPFFSPPSTPFTITVGIALHRRHSLSCAHVGLFSRLPFACLCVGRRIEARAPR